MKNSGALARIDQFIADLEKQLQDAREIRSILERSPQFADALMASLAPVPVPPLLSELKVQPVVRIPGERGGPATREHYSRIVEWLRSTGNAWAKTQAIEDATKLTRNQITNILYKVNKDSFEGRKSPDNARDKEWRVKPEIASTSVAVTITEVTGEQSTSDL